jgi:hypothetical protein
MSDGEEAAFATPTQRSILSVLVFGSYRFAVAFNRGAQRVPRKTRAFDAGGEFAHAGEGFSRPR